MHIKSFWPLSILLPIGIVIIFSVSHNTKFLWIEKFKKYDMNTVIQRLGYDPMISLYSPYSVLSNEQVTVYAHGWGDSQKSIEYIQRNSHILPGAIVGFNFRDANFNVFLPPYHKSSFCQSLDIEPLLLTLKVLDECDIKRINLFGHSRGGGTIVTTIGRLHRYKKYKNFFKKLDINPEQAKKILQKIQAGTIVLNCPLVDINTILKEKLSWFNLDWLSQIIRYTILPHVTSYRPNQDNPLVIAKKIQTLDLKILIHFQKDDMIVGNGSDALFYKNIMGPHTYLVIGDSEGHIHTSELLSGAIQSFNKKYGSPQYPHYAAGVRDDLLQQPARAFVKQYIDTAYKQPTSPFINFNSKHKKQWEKAFEQYDLNPIIETLGYNPHIKMYKADGAVKGSDLTVYVHGYGEYASMTIPFFQHNSYLLPGTILGFDFPDVIPGTCRPNLKKSNVGQEKDITTLVLLFKILDECGIEKLNIFGSSRGGAATVNTLARLCTYDLHSSFFTALNISKKQAARIIRKIQRGTIVLNCPLVDTRSVATHWFGRLNQWIINTVIPLITCHNAEHDQAIDGAKIIQKMNFRIIVHFEHKDKIVGNARDADFYKTIMGKHTYLILANDGGHLHSGITLGQAIQSFRKRYGFSYYYSPDLLKAGNLLLKEGHLKFDQVDNFIKNKYESFCI